MRARNSAGVMPIASAPALSTNFFCTSGRLSVWRTSLLMRSTTPCGVPLGASRPTQMEASRSGMPASRGVAHDGSSGDFFAGLVPMTFPRAPVADGWCAVLPPRRAHQLAEIVERRLGVGEIKHRRIAHHGDGNEVALEVIRHVVEERGVHRELAGVRHEQRVAVRRRLRY